MKKAIFFSLCLFTSLALYAQVQLLEQNGITFRIDPRLQIERLKDQNGNQSTLLGSDNFRVTLAELLGNQIIESNGINYNGKTYQYNDFGGQLRSYFDAIKITSLGLTVDVSGLKDCSSFSYAVWRIGEYQTKFCALLPNAAAQITGYRVSSVSASGVNELKQKISELEKQQSQTKAASQNAQAKVSSNPIPQTKPTGTPTNKPTSQTVSPTQQANALINDGNTLYYQGKYQEAISKYNEALRLDPGNITATQNKNNAVDAANQQIREKNKQQQAAVSQQTVQNFADVSTKIATSVLADRKGRFGFMMAGGGDHENLGISWGNTDAVHINMGADFSAFKSFFVSLDMMGLRLLGTKRRTTSNTIAAIVPSMGLLSRFADTDDDGNTIDGSPDYTAFQLGLMGVLDSGGFYIKFGYMNNIAYISSKEKPNVNGTLVLGIGFGKR